MKPKSLTLSVLAMALALSGGAEAATFGRLSGRALENLPGVVLQAKKKRTQRRYDGPVLEGPVGEIDAREGRRPRRVQRNNALDSIVGGILFGTPGGVVANRQAYDGYDGYDGYEQTQRPLQRKHASRQKNAYQPDGGDGGSYGNASASGTGEGFENGSNGLRASGRRKGGGQNQAGNGTGGESSFGGADQAGNGGFGNQDAQFGNGAANGAGQGVGQDGSLGNAGNFGNGGNAGSGSAIAGIGGGQKAGRPAGWQPAAASQPGGTDEDGFQDFSNEQQPKSGGRRRDADGNCPVDYTTPFPEPCTD